MKEQQRDSVQNQFTAYLMSAITNCRINYFDKKLKRKEREVISQELLEQGFTSFEHQYHIYVSEREWQITKNWEDTELLTELLQTPRLIRIVRRLHEQERKILYARIFGELSFEELGEIFHKTPYQMEMSYCYILRKLKRELGGHKDEI